ncbi:hypothetical protein [Aliirhizobium smilacinae]|uniref:hypothetical protein n=1 Tax=Aliirhizobium smilacinae TaxID=1395944 RepID=UPI0015D5DA05|nr:hypothetical protein [Rhizobium smilacinae]
MAWTAKPQGSRRALADIAATAAQAQSRQSLKPLDLDYGDWPARVGDPPERLTAHVT